MSRTRTFLRKLTTHPTWKLAALALSIGLWIFIEGAPEFVTIQVVPLLYRNLQEGLILTSDTPENVRAELRGTSVKLTASALSEISVSLDLAGISGPGERSFTLSASNFTVPQGVSVLRTVPSQVRVIVDRLSVKEVSVKVRTSAPPPGYRIVSQSVEPRKLRVSGPEPRLDLLDSVETDLIDVRSGTGTSVMQVNAFVRDSRVQFDSPSTVTVTLKLDRTQSR
jgi:hypothetical protein